jgi:hypothetical protein
LKESSGNTPLKSRCWQIACSAARFSAANRNCRRWEVKKSAQNRSESGACYLIKRALDPMPNEHHLRTARYEINA